MPTPTVAGYILARERRGQLIPDWDHEIHRNREDGDAALAESAEDTDCYQMYALVRAADPQPCQQILDALDTAQHILGHVADRQGRTITRELQHAVLSAEKKCRTAIAALAEQTGGAA